MKLFNTLTLIIIINLSGCSSPQEESSLKIIANSWIGYSTLFYAKESGWLEAHDIQLSTVISLGESLNIYETAELDAFTGTQYEFKQAQQKDPTLIPVIIFDRSNGGDSILANASIEALHQTTEVIDVYLEMHSVNQLVFQDFIKKHQLTDKTFNYINRDQIKTYSYLESKPPTQATIIVTYVPYTQKLLKIGFKELASTRQGLDILVLDALFASQQSFSKHQQQFIQLKSLHNRALLNLQNNPLEYYKKVKPHLENTSYEDFLNSLKDIEWLNTPLKEKLIQRLDDSHFPIKDLL